MREVQSRYNEKPFLSEVGQTLVKITHMAQSASLEVFKTRLKQALRKLI